MNEEIKEALLRSHQVVLRAELYKAAIAAQIEREQAVVDAYSAGYKAGFMEAWNLPR